MQKITPILFLIICFFGCKSSKHVSKSKAETNKVIINKTSPSKSDSSIIADHVIDYAKRFNGVKYKYGGTTKKGVDCSGLVITSFKSEDIVLPRTTKDLSVSGDWVDLKDVKKGDLLFFATKKNSRRVNHVAIVTSARTGYVEFIHATTSEGVIVSNLAERYWYFAFVQARRIL